MDTWLYTFASSGLRSGGWWLRLLLFQLLAFIESRGLLPQRRDLMMLEMFSGCGVLNKTFTEQGMKSLEPYACCIKYAPATWNVYV